MNYYETLNVRRNATSAEIHAAYNTLMKKFDPEKYNGDALFAESRRKALTEAYLVLSNPATRSNYDKKNYTHTKSHIESDDVYKNYYKPNSPAPHTHNDNIEAMNKYTSFTKHISDDPYSDPIIDYEDSRITFDTFSSNSKDPISGDFSTVKLILFLIILFIVISKIMPLIEEVSEILK